MNEEAIKYAHELFVKDGYPDGLNDFKALIKSDPEALKYAYQLFEKDGFKDGRQAFDSLMGVSSNELKKKGSSQPSGEESTEPQGQPTTPSAKPTPKAPLPSTPNELLYTGALKGFGGESKQGKKIQETASRVKEEQKKPEVSDIEEIDITEKSDAISAPKFADPVVTKQGADLSKTLFYERSKNTDVFKIPTPGESKEYAEKITENYLDYLSDFEPDKAENLRNAYNTLITKPKNERTAQDERFLRDLQSDAIDMDVKSKDHRIDQIFNRIGELQKTAVNQDGIKELNDLYGEYYKTKNNVQGAVGAYNLNRRSYGLAEGDEFEEQRIKRERFERLEKGEGKASEFFRGVGGAILRGSVSIAQVPKVLGDLVGDTDYDWADELYYSIEGGKNTMERDFGAPLPEGKTWSDLPFMARAASVGGNALGSAGLYAAGGGLFGGATKLSQGVATFGTAFLTSESDYYQEAIDAGMDNQDAAFFGSWMAAQTAFLESLIPDVKYLSTDPFRKSVRNGFMDGIKSGATKSESIKLAFKNSIKALPESAFDRIKTGTKETFVEEFPQQLAEDISKTAVNSMGQKEYFNDTFNPDAYVDAIIGSYVATTGLSVFSRPQSKSPVQEELIREVVERKDDLFEKGTATDKKTQPEYKKEVEKAAELLSAMKSHSSWNNLSREEQNHALAIAQQAEVIKEEQEQMKKIGVEDESKNLELQKIDKELKDIFSIQRGREIEAEKERKRKELEDEFNQSLSQEYDQKDQTGLPSQVGEGQKPIEAQPIQGAGTETAEASGVLQTPEEVTLKNGDNVTPTKISGQTKFFHASPKKREGRLKASEAPQWGEAIYFATNKESATDEFGGDNVTEASLNLKNPVYTNTKDFEDVKKKATELYNREMLPKILKEEAELVNGKWRFFDEDLQAEYDKNGYIDRYSSDYIEEGKYFGQAAKELGYDAIIDEGNQYGSEIAVLDENAVIYPEDIESKEPSQAGSVVGGDVKQQELDAQKINKEAGVDVYVARQGVETNGEKYTLSQIKENGNTNTFVIEDANGSEIGKAQLSADGNYLENIRIDEKHRRKGLASMMYDFVELRKGIKLEPSPNKQSKEAKALWDKRKQSLKETPKKQAAKPQPKAETTQAQMEFPEPIERNDENINALLQKKNKYNSLSKKTRLLSTNLLNEIRSMAKDMGIEVTFAAGFQVRLTDKGTGKQIVKRGVDRTINKDKNELRKKALQAAGNGELGMYARIMLWFRAGGKVLPSQSELGENTPEMKEAKRRGYVGDDAGSIELTASQLAQDVLGINEEFADEYVYDNGIVFLFHDFLSEYGSSSKEDIENAIVDIYVKNTQEQNEEVKGRFEVEYGKGALGLLNQELESESKPQEETPQPESSQSTGEDEFSFGGMEPDFRRVKGPTERGEAVSGAEAVKMVENFLKASGINVTVLNDKDFDALLGKKGYSVDADGMFMTNDNTGEVLIRRSGLESKYGDVIVFHEGIHPVINIIRNTDPKLYNAIVQGIKNEAKTNKKIQGIISEVERVMEGEPASAVEDEIVTEVFARIASGDVKLSEIKKSLAEKIIYYANKIAKLLGLNKRIGINPSDIEFRDFANDLTTALRQGGSITDVVGRGKEKEFINEKTKDGRTITTNQEGSFISESGNVQYSRRGIVRGEKDKGGSADTTVKNVWNQYKGIKFNGSVKIEDASDVAHIMRQLENKSVEHAFAVHVDEKGKPHIQFLGMGGVASVIVDPMLVLAGAKRYNSKQVYLVHNHPSGSMNPSGPDISITQEIRQLLSKLDISVEHVIVDTYKREFVHIDTSNYPSVQKRDVNKENNEKYLKSLKTEMMDELEILSAPLAKITNPRATAQFFTQMRFTALPKNGMLVMDRQNQVIGNYILPGGFNYKDITDNLVGAGVGQSVIFYSNEDNYKDISSIKGDLEKARVSVLDYILVDSNSQSVNDFYKSYADEGLLRETQQEYGTTPVEKQKAQFSRKMDRDMAVTPSGEVVKTKPLPEGLAIINGFYSPIEKNLMEYGKDKIKAKDWLNVVGKGDEAVFTGVRAFLEGKDPNAMVSKQEILDYMKDNRISVVEVVKGGEAKELTDKEIKDAVYTDSKEWVDLGNGVKVRNINGSNVRISINGAEETTNFIEAENKIHKALNTDNRQTKFSQYQLEGEKENYKEVLVTLPGGQTEEGLPRGWKVIPKEEYEDAWSGSSNYLVIDEDGFSVIGGDTREDAINAYKKFKPRTNIKDTKFKSTHFSEPNILVHLRMNTRTDAEGKKVLFLEEVQSDWGQKGKKEGFENPAYSVKLSDKEIDGVKLYDILMDGKPLADIDTRDLAKWYENKYREKLYPRSANENQANKVAERLNDALTEGKVPTAPFVMDTNAWTKLGLKVALKEAVAQGVDKIAWTTGEQQNDRYDLSKQVNKIEWRRDGDSYTLNITGIDNNTGRPESTLKAKDAKELEGIVGKEIAQKIFDESEKKNKKVKIESKVFQEGSWRKAWSYETPSGYVRKAKEDTKESALEGAKEAWGATSSNGVVEGDNLKVGGKGMKGFYGSMEEGTKGIVGGVAEKLSGQELGETKIGEGEVFSVKKNRSHGYDVFSNKEGFMSNFDTEVQAKEYAERMMEDYGSKQTSQPSIDITPEIKAEVLRGQAQFSRKMSRDLSEEERSQSIEGVKTEMARIEDSISEGADPQTAYDELFATQEYADISMDVRMKVNAAIKKAYPNVTTAENIARGLTESYEKREAKVADVLRSDRDLAYIYRNFPSIIDQLKENKVIEIEGDCV